MSANKKNSCILVVLCFAMLGLGFASKPLYDTFCRITGYGGTTGYSEDNLSEIFEREVKVNFDSNVNGLPWDFLPEQSDMSVKLGQTGLSVLQGKNTSNKPMIGTATFNVTPIKAAPFFIKTECFCFTEQRVEPGEELSMPVIIFC